MMTEQYTPVTQITHSTTSPPKPIAITLSWYIKDYKVAQITNTTWYKPGQWLAPPVVQRLCDLPGWTVIMADNQLLSEITGALITNAVKAIPMPTI